MTFLLCSYIQRIGLQRQGKDLLNMVRDGLFMLNDVECCVGVGARMYILLGWVQGE